MDVTPRNVKFTRLTTVMTKLDKLASKNNDKAPLWKLKEEHRTKATHELVGKTYTTNKRLISFRAGIVEREMTEEQRRETAERLRKWRENNRDRNRRNGRDRNRLRYGGMK